MLTFDPPDLESKLRIALSDFSAASGLEPSDLQGDFFDPTSEDYDPSDFEDLTITPGSECSVSLPCVGEDFRITYRDLIDILVEARTARIEDNIEVWSPRQYLLRVSTDEFVAISVIEREFNRTKEFGPSRIFEHAEIVDGRNIVCCLARGFTLFGVLVASGGEYNKYFPPTIYEEYFICVSFPVDTPELTVRNVAQAYIFELSTSHNIHLTRYPRPTLVEESPYDVEDGQDEAACGPLRLRPLLLGTGMLGMIELFNKARSVESSHVAILYYAKVIEYASPTILRQKLTTTIQNKLSSQRAMSPDAQFILELDNLFQENRIYKKDKESIALTIGECCDMDELKNVAPPFLKELAGLKDNATKHDRDVGSRNFASALSATRNYIAHAKANYRPTGEECPESQLSEFRRCADLAAQQVIRWFARCPEHLRVV